MYSIKTLIFIILCLKTSATLILNQSSCLKQILSELAKDVESLAISWSDDIGNEIKDEVSKLGKINFIIDRQVTTKMCADHNPDAVIILASKEADIVGEISSVFIKNSHSVISKLIIVYLDEGGNDRNSSTDLFFQDVFPTFAIWNAFHVQFIHKFNDEYEVSSWFPNKDNKNYVLVDRVRLVSECESGFYRKHSETPMKMHNGNALDRIFTAVVQSHEPYSFYSKESTSLKEFEIDLVKELAHWLYVNVEINVIALAELNERYVNCVLIFRIFRQVDNE